ncbi:claspin [Cephus cinctus]|uniref:Claspin n=1 Tax=Cephus cinctus TaxID=211228 RepID=A0AAJ7BFJ7_CEPCN|nr:claspin [Cephus cinctus]
MTTIVETAIIQTSEINKSDTMNVTDSNSIITNPFNNESDMLSKDNSKENEIDNSKNQDKNDSIQILTNVLENNKNETTFEMTDNKLENAKRVSEETVLIDSICGNNHISKTEEDIGELISMNSEDVIPDDGDDDIQKSIHKNMLSIVDSESEDEDFSSLFQQKDNTPKDDFNPGATIGTNPLKYTKVSYSKSRRILDSDSDADEPSGIKNDGDDENHSITSNSDSDKSVQKSKPNGNKINDLIDSDSDDDNNQNTRNDFAEEDHNDQKSAEQILKKATKKRTQTARSSKEEAMRQIRSESQRLVRESNVSLPYHRPKQRTLQEFLNRRKLVSTLPKAPTTAAKVRMSSNIVSQVLKEKEKEAELFYKSSDSEEETNDKELPKETPVHINVTNDLTTVSNNADSTDIEETQKMMNGNVQNAHNKKEIIRQGTYELGVPRKLFGLDSEEINEQENVETEEQEENIQKPVKEYKHGLKEVSVPRQLFGNDYQDDTDSNTKRKDIQESNTPDTLQNRNNDDGQSDTIDTLIKSLEDEINKSNVKENTLKETDNLVEADDDILLEMAKDDVKIVEPDEQQHVKDKESLPANNTISETPFISNKELAKLNKKDNISTSSVINQVDKSDSSKMEETELSTPIGHVYGLPFPEFEDDIPIEKPSAIKKKILPNVPNVRPTLRGISGMVIDFSQDVKPSKEGVNNLMNRFLKHTAIINKAETVTDVTVIHTEITADGVTATKQVIPYKIEGEKNDSELNKPGAKHVRLREELKQKMFTKRTEEWEQKEQEMKTLEKELYGDEKSTCGMDDEELEEEIEELSGSGESEPEEDDMPLRENKQKKNCPFLDNEAEVSDEEDIQKTGDDDDDEDEYCEKERNVNNEEKEIDYDEEEDEHEEDQEEQEQDEDEDDDDDEDDTKEDGLHEARKRKRIVKAFDENSNESTQSDDKTVNTEKPSFTRTKTDIDMFDTDGNNDWISDEEDELPAFQPRNNTSDIRSQACQTPLVTTNCLSFVSPITQLTALNTHMESAKKQTPTNDVYSLPITDLPSTEKTPVIKSLGDRSLDKRIGPQKKLFEEDTELVKDEELMEVCSGRFTATENIEKDLSALLDSSMQTKSSEVQLLNIFSGSFSTQQSQENQEENSRVDIEEDSSESTRLTLEKNSQLSVKSPIKNKKSETPWTALRVVSTDEEEEILRDTNDEIVKKKKLTKKKVKKLELSDEEDSDAERLTEVDEDEEEQEENCELENEEKYIDYDSEENEIVVVPKKEIKKVAATFLENEAELSESEWGSADEDEKDLDKLEYEEGDNEEIDENQMKDQLGRIHMRQVLDDDQRNVRMIKELLFEDGDLYTDGAGRERKFRWKNMDNFGEDVNNPLGDNADATLEITEEENELQWRKLRLEREKFLEEKKKSGEIKDDIEEDMGSSQFFKLGMKALQKRKCVQSGSQDSSNGLSKSTDPIMPRTILDLLDSPTIGAKSSILRTAVKRGSFLARGEESLARLAAMVNQNTETTICGAKNSRNFVFAHVSPAIKNDEENQETTDENISDNNLQTRKRKSNAGVTPRTAKKKKIEASTSKGKKLFL